MEWRDIRELVVGKFGSYHTYSDDPLNMIKGK